MSEAQDISLPTTPMTIETVIHRPALNEPGLRETPPRPETPMSTETVIHHAPQAPKKLKTKVIEFLKPDVYKPESDETPSASKRILKALSLAGVPKSPKLKAKKLEKKSYPKPRKLTLDIVDGKTGTIIQTYVPVYRLMNISSKAKRILESKPRASRYKIYGAYSPASVSSVLGAIIYLQPIPVSTTKLVDNLLTYEACLRLGISKDRTELKPLLSTIHDQISTGPIDNEVLAFVTYHLGPKDPVFKHTANVLCHQRFVKSVPDVKAFEKMVAKKPALQKAMVQIDQAHKARREAFRKNKETRSGSEADDEVSDSSNVDKEKKITGQTVENMLEKIARAKETKYKQKKELLSLFKDDGTVREAIDDTGKVEKTGKADKLE